MLFLMLTLLAASPATSPPGRPTLQAAVQVGDGRVLGVLGSVDANQIESAKLAATKATHKRVRDLAGLLLRDHQRSLERNAELARQLRLTRLLPDDSVMARTHLELMVRLNLLSGEEFDRAYLQSVIADHEAVRHEITSELLPGASRSRVKEYVRKTRVTLEAHLVATRALVAALQ